MRISQQDAAGLQIVNRPQMLKKSHQPFKLSWRFPHFSE